MTIPAHYLDIPGIRDTMLTPRYSMGDLAEVVAPLADQEWISAHKTVCHAGDGGAPVVFARFTDPQANEITKFIGTFDPALVQSLLEQLAVQYTRKGSLAIEVDQFTTRVKDLQRELDQKANLLVEREERASALARENADLRHENQGVRVGDASVRDVLSRRDAEIARLKETAARNIARIDEDTIEKVELRRKLQEAETKLEVQDQLIEEVNRRLDDLAEKATSVETAFTSQSYWHTATVAQLHRVQAELAEARGQLVEAQSQLEDRDQEVAEFKVIRDRLVGELSEANKEATRYRRRLFDQKNAEFQYERNSNTRMIEGMANLQGRLDIAERKAADQSMIADGALAKLHELTEQLNAANEQLQAAREHIHAHPDFGAAMVQAKLDEVEAELERTRALLAGVNLQLDNAKGEHRDEAKRLNKEILHLRRTVEQERQANRDAARQIDRFREELNMEPGTYLAARDGYEHMFGFSQSYDMVPKMVVDNERYGWRLVQVVHVPASNGYSIIFGRKLHA